MSYSSDKPRRVSHTLITIELLTTKDDDGDKLLYALVSPSSEESVTRHLWPLGKFGTPTPEQLQDIVTCIARDVTTEIVLQLPPQLALFVPPEAT